MNSKYFSAAAIIGLMFLSAPLFSQSKIDPFFNSTNSFEVTSIKGITTRQDATLIDVLIKTSDVEKTASFIVAGGGVVNLISGDIILATVREAFLGEISKAAEVIYIEASKPINVKNDVAALDIGDYLVQSGEGLSSSYSGKGVIVGLIDSGIDYDHPDFRDVDGKSRILAIWDQRGSGAECDEYSIANGNCFMRDRDGHGTHVAGIMAGGDTQYKGVASEANIIAVTYDSSMGLDSGYADTIFSSKICQAASYVFEKASELHMPSVVNLSLGTHIGAHDGTSLFEECLANLVKGHRGRAIVAAAGNEHSSDESYTGIHTGFDITDISATNFVIKKISNGRIYYIDLWGEKDSEISVGLAIHRGKPAGDPLGYSGQILPRNRADGFFEDNLISYTINAEETQNPLNGKQHVGIVIELDLAVIDPSIYSFDLVVNGKGSFDAWLFPDKPQKTIQFTSVEGDMGVEWKFIAGDRIKNISIPSTSPEIISVAGYTTRNEWDGGGDCCKVIFELGEILDFSSAGPSTDEASTGVKPDIAAPGALIASTLSSDASPDRILVMPDSIHVLQAGTSMSAPFVSGAIALMFSANSDLTSEDVKKYLLSNATVDDAVGEIPNDRWGYGKLNIPRTVEDVLKNGATDIGLNDAEINAVDPSQGGCSLVNR